MTGIENSDKNSFINATIQCLSNIKELSNYFLKKYGKFDLEKQEMAFAYSSLLYELFNYKQKFISINLFNQSIFHMLKKDKEFKEKFNS